MNKLTFTGGAVGVSLAVFCGLHVSNAADHLDSSMLVSNPMADINDVYAWMADSSTINLAMTVSPKDDGTRNFSPSVLYAFHVSSRNHFPAANMPGIAFENRVICKFASNTDGECWVLNSGNQVLDYVKGDFSATAGVASASGTMRVFAGRRSDPFFFNFGGFALASEAAVSAANCNGDCPGALGKDAAGCPNMDPARATALVTAIGTAPPAPAGGCPANEIDCFADLNVKAIVVQVEKSLILSGTDTLVSVWASTHAGQ